MIEVTETAVSIVSEGTRIEGKMIFDRMTRVHGTLAGKVFANDGSTLILGETSVVEGDIQADTLIVDGFVRGDINAKTRVVVSGTGRVLGNIKTPALVIQFGAHFEGNCMMEDANGLTSSPELSPA